MRKLITYFVFILLGAYGCADSAANQVRDGDIIFHISRSSQSIAIQKATHSNYSHMGIIFYRNGVPYVYEATKTVQYTPLKKWIARGEGKHFMVKRFRNAGQPLSPDEINKLKKAASHFKGKPYDLTFEWSDDRIYCSELVWKIYERGTGVQIGRLQKLRDFDLTDSVVKQKMKERYGAAVPLDEPVISPGAMFSSSDLITVMSQ